MPLKSKKRATRKRRQQDQMHGDDVAGWITPDLENHPVGEIGAHLDWAINHFNLPDNIMARDYVDPYKIAFIHGYVRYRSNGRFFDVEGKKENIAKTENVWGPFAKNKHIYVTYVDSPSYARPPLKEGREYLGKTGEYGGWITKDKVVHPVDPYSHSAWVGDQYGTDPETGHVESYDAAFEDGAVRYLLGKNGLELNGYVDAIKALFNIWWPTAIRKDSVLIEPEPDQNEEPSFDVYHMPEHKQHLLSKWNPGHPIRTMVKKMKIDEHIQLNELREYLGLKDEYGGWITKDKKIHVVGWQAHRDWLKQNYGEVNYVAVFKDGILRYQQSDRELSIEGTIETIFNTFRLWWPTAISRPAVYIDVIDPNKQRYDSERKRFGMPEDKSELLALYGAQAKLKYKQEQQKDPDVKESIQLNELVEYLGLEDEYGGWITSDKEVHIVPYEGHTNWVVAHYFDNSHDKYMDAAIANNYNWYETPFEDGAIRYVISRGELYLQGNADAIINLFRIWWPTAINSTSVSVDTGSRSDYFSIPEQKGLLRKKFGLQGRTPNIREARDLSSKVKEAKFGSERRDRTLKGKSGYTVSIFKHEVNNLDEDKWNESVQKIKDVKSGMSHRGALRLQRKIIDELKNRNIHNDNGWVDYFTRIEEDDLNETEGGTVGHMFRGGYESGMRSTAKNTKKRKPMSPFSKINEKYNTNSTWLKVGKNIVEVILNKVTRRIKRGSKITEVEIPTYKIFVDGVDVGYVDNIDGMFYVKNDKDFDKYDTLEEAISKVMGPSYYDGKGSTEFVQYNPDPYALNV